MPRLLPFGLFVFALVLFGCTGGNTPKRGGNKERGEWHTQDKKSVDSEVKKAAEPNPDFNLTAEQLGLEFLANRIAAEAKYVNKTIELTGAVWFTGPKGSAFLTGLKTEAAGLNLVGAIKVGIRADDWFACDRLSKGQKVKVVGKFVLDPNCLTGKLIDCRLTALEPNKLTKVTALVLAQAFEEDAATAEAKYNRMDIVVTGVLEKATQDPRRGYCARLKGTATTGVAVVVELTEVNEIKGLKPGIPVEMRISGSVYFQDNDAVLTGGFLLKDK